jgi:hypothetical protein
LVIDSGLMISLMRMMSTRVLFVANAEPAQLHDLVTRLVALDDLAA